MLIDSCASGGRRNDLETLRRAVPLLRSDYIIEPVGNQCHTYGISFWMPFYGTGLSGAIDPYMLRSVHVPALHRLLRHAPPRPRLRYRSAACWASGGEFAPYYFGDYYPLTPYSLESTVWMAWQFDRPETGEGVVQAFRRADCIYPAAELRLAGLDPQRRYNLRDLDTGTSRVISGHDLATSTAPFQIASRPGSAVWVYRPAP